MARRIPINPDQFRESDTKDFQTGYRNAWVDVEVPDHQPGEPTAIRAQAQELGPNRWNVRVVHGPHTEKDESGSYYKDVDRFPHEGSMATVKSKIRSAAKNQYKDLVRRRSS